MYYLMVTLFFITTSCANTEKSVVTLWASHHVLLEPSAPSWLPSTVSPKTIEKELLAVAAANTAYKNEYASQQPGNSLSLVTKSWLLDQIDGDIMGKFARNNISWTQPILFLASKIAFSPDSAAKQLEPIAKIVVLAQACKENGALMALSCNSNTASFAAVEKQHSEVFSLFGHKFISGKRKKLTIDPAFFCGIKKELGPDHTYYYIDVLEGTGTESLDAARQAGINPITVTTPDRLKTDLKALKLLR